MILQKQMISQDISNLWSLGLGAFKVFIPKMHLLPRQKEEYREVYGIL